MFAAGSLPVYWPPQQMRYVGLDREHIMKHITEVGFVDPNFPDDTKKIGTDKLVLFFADPKAVGPLRDYATAIQGEDPELAEAIGHRLDKLHNKSKG